MKTAVIIPTQGYTTEFVVISTWKRRLGEIVEKGETLFEMESDKVVLEMAAPCSGELSEILKDNGEEANIGEIVAYIEC